MLGVPSDADVTSLAPEIVVSEGTNVCSPLSGVPQNFSSTVTYTVSGKGLATRVYSVDILDADGKRPTGKNDTPDTPSTPDTPVVASAKITEFSILGVKAVIDDEAGTILLTLPAGTRCKSCSISGDRGKWMYRESGTRGSGGSEKSGSLYRNQWI